MRHRLFAHIIWTTRERRALIDDKVAAFLLSFLPAVAQQERCTVLELGIVRTHIHMIVRLHPSTNIPKLLQRLKGGSSVIANREGHATRDNPLRWARGYTLESVGLRALGSARNYVRNQHLRHPEEAIDSGQHG